MLEDTSIMLYKISLWRSLVALHLLSSLIVVVTGWTVVRRRPQSIIISHFQAAHQQPVESSLLLFRPIINQQSLPRQTISPSHSQKISSLKSINSGGATVTTDDDSCFYYYPVFSFAESPEDTVNKFDRIDDVIMGGISNSALMPVTTTATTTATEDTTTTGGQHSYAKWFGNIRTDGGGFCGIRTLPFVDPLNVLTTNKEEAGAGADVGGFYITCRLVSDNEPERRVWKMSTRIKPDRGEQLYQARFELPTRRISSTKKDDDNDKDKNKKNNDDDDDDEIPCWAVIRIPFDDFKLVRGPRTVLNGPALNVTTSSSSSGIYQIGLTVSKFEMAENMTELENFRAGFFEMQIKEIGVYGATTTRKKADTDNGQLIAVVESPVILTKQQAKEKRPLIAKIIFLPVAKLFFSEQAQRRKSAMKLLRNKRGLSRLGAIMFGIRVRARSFGLVSSLAKTIEILLTDSVRNVFILSLKICIVYPILAVRALKVKLFNSLFTTKDSKEVKN